MREGVQPQHISQVIEMWKGRYKDEVVVLKAFKMSHQGPHSIRGFKHVSTRLIPQWGVAFRCSDTRQIICREIAYIKQFEHRNILPVYGVSTTIAPFCLVYPWYKNGNIMESLKKEPNANRYDLASASRQIPYS